MRVSSRFSESMISCLEVGLHRRHLCKFANTDCFVASVETSDVTGPDIPPALLTASDILRNTGNRMPFPRKPKKNNLVLRTFHSFHSFNPNIHTSSSLPPTQSCQILYRLIQKHSNLPNFEIQLAVRF